MRIPFPTLTEENALWKLGKKYVCGVDEVGRGAFAGPVVSAAVILSPDFPLSLGIHDSKLLTKKKREEVAEIIKEKAVAYAIDAVCVECINKEGVGKSAQKSFVNSIVNLIVKPEFILIDAFYIKDIDKTIQKPIIKGDQKCLSIAAASVIAKVYRDNLMTILHKDYPNYHFNLNKGYGTSAHRSAIQKYGLTPHHRTSFNLEKYLTL